MSERGIFWCPEQPFILIMHWVPESSRSGLCWPLYPAPILPGSARTGARNLFPYPVPELSTSVPRWQVFVAIPWKDESLSMWSRWGKGIQLSVWAMAVGPSSEGGREGRGSALCLSSCECLDRFGGVCKSGKSPCIHETQWPHTLKLAHSWLSAIW